MKVMLLSVKPKWLCKILNGEKTREVRKLLPYDYRGLVLVYCSKAKKCDEYLICNTRDKKSKLTFKNCFIKGDELNGKVVALLNCDDVTVQEAEFDSKNSDYFNFCRIWNVYGSPNDWRKDTTPDDLTINILNEAFMTQSELREYLGKKKYFYTMKISNVRVFENPKELTQFHSYDMCTGQPAKLPLRNPPQNYCYVYFETPIEKLLREMDEAITAEKEKAMKEAK